MRVIRFFVGLLLIPVCIAATRTVVSLVQSLESAGGGVMSPAVLALGGGFLIWLMLFFTVPRPLRTYVLAHELTHALWGSLMGARISGMKVSKEKGSVTLSKTNFLITLAPYFFPLYTVIVVAGYYVASIFYDIEAYFPFWLALIGLTWGFHFTFTISTLLQHQTDIQTCGYLFSYVVIYLFNVIGIGIWIVIVSSCTFWQMAVFLKNDLAWISLLAWKEGSLLWKNLNNK